VDGIATALSLHDSCHANGVCSLPTNTTLVKRWDGGDFVSYTDWGADHGYEQDYVDWNYEYLTAHDYSHWLGEYTTAKLQDCTDAQCYGHASKYCLSVGWSRYRMQQSVAVCEVYENAYGGVDGRLRRSREHSTKSINSSYLSTTRDLSWVKKYPKTPSTQVRVVNGRSICWLPFILVYIIII
jgi:hypothetical protein